MTILIATPWPLRSPGGGQRLAHALAAALADRGLDVVVAAGSGPIPRSFDCVSDARCTEIRLPLGDARTTRPPGDLSQLRLNGLEALAERLRPHAIVFTPHYSSCARQAAAAASRLGIPFVMCPAIHMDHPVHTSADARSFYRLADAVWCLSDVERDWLIRRAGVSADRTLIVPLSCAVPPAPPRQPLACRPLHLLTVGAFARHKQIDHQLEALELLRRRDGVDARLTIAGGGDSDSAAGRLEAVAHRRGQRDRVEFVVNASDGQLTALYRAADCFLFTSRSESFGIAVMEAIAHGTFPIVYPHAVYRTLVEIGRPSAWTRKTSRTIPNRVRSIRFQ